MDGTTRPLADGCLRDKRAPVEAAIETEKQVIAPLCEWKHNGGPELEYLIQTRDRLAAHADAPAPTTRWCVCDNLHHHDVFAPPVLMEGRNARHSWGKGLVYQPRKRAGLASRSMRPNGASYRQCDGATGSEKDRLNLGGTIRLRHDVNDI
jgi:hypothetical protein